MTSTPLNDAELDRLSSVLERFGNQRSMNLEQLDGFLARIMHHAERFCTSFQLACAGDPSVWIGVRPLAVQRVRD